jgi:hypothetical protein
MLARSMLLRDAAAGGVSEEAEPGVRCRRRRLLVGRRGGRRGVAGLRPVQRRRAGDDGRAGGPEEREVEAPEEGVRLHVGGAAAGPEAPGRVLGEEASDEVPRRGVGGARGGRGERERAACDVAERGLVVGAGERGAPVEELVEEHAEGPPVHGGAVGPAPGDLGGHVLVRAHERAGARVHGLRHERPRRGGAALAPVALEQVVREAGHGGGCAVVVGISGLQRRRGRGLQRQVEVDEHDVAVGADQHVLRLEVAVHDAHHVQVLQRQQHLRRVEPAPLAHEIDRRRQHPSLWTRKKDSIFGGSV